jgi:hypothetical protein
LLLRETTASFGTVTVADIYVSVDAQLSFGAGEYLLFCEENTGTWTFANCDYYFSVGDASFRDFETPYNTSVTNPADDGAFVFDYFTSGTDSNTLTIGFVDDTGTSTTVDFVEYDSTFAHFTSGYSMEATPSATAANNNGTAKWVAADAASVYSDGGMQRGTPGCNNTYTTCP